jgi:hypothetical protein
MAARRRKGKTPHVITTCVAPGPKSLTFGERELQRKRRVLRDKGGLPRSAGRRRRASG